MKKHINWFWITLISVLIPFGSYAGVSNLVTSANIKDGAITTAKIADNAVTTAKITDSNITLAKLANMSTASILGRNTAGTGVPEVLSALTTKSLLSLNNVDNTSDSTKNSATATLTNKTIKIAKTLGSDTTVEGLVQDFTAGENLVYGDLCYLKAADGKAWKADANGTSTYPVLLMATGTINANETGTFLKRGTARQDSWNWTTGSLLYLSTTAGSITATKPSTIDDVIQTVAMALDADTIDFNPSFTYGTAQ